MIVLYWGCVGKGRGRSERESESDCVMETEAERFWRELAIVKSAEVSLLTRRLGYWRTKAQELPGLMTLFVNGLDNLPTATRILDAELAREESKS